jgi:hypothetical protein
MSQEISPQPLPSPPAEKQAQDDGRNSGDTPSVVEALYLHHQQKYLHRKTLNSRSNCQEWR